MTAEEAADFLGVKRQTIYAYASRGLLHSYPDPDEPRRRLYVRRELERLDRRSAAHRGEGAAAASALEWGPASMETEVGDITGSGPVYRGELATSLVDGDRRFEEIAEFLWTAEWPEEIDWPLTTPRVGERSQAAVDGTRLIERLRVTVAKASLRDLGRFTDTVHGRVRCARRLYAELLEAIIFDRRGEVPRPFDGVVDALVVAFDVEPSPASRAALRAALVMVADHGLNASTFTARVTSSTGADLYAAVQAALATLSGPKHGGAVHRCARLVDDMLHRGSSRSVIVEAFQRGEKPPGFDHPLYPAGDPRFRKVCRFLADVSDVHLDLAADIEDVADELEVGSPTIDLGLAVLANALDMKGEGASALFAVGRLAGWIAHAIEQQQRGVLLRPRAVYVVGRL